MSIAPLHGRPAPLVFSANPRIKWPRYRPAELKNAPLTSRARRERNRRRIRNALAVASLAIATTAAFWAWLSWRG